MAKITNYARGPRGITLKDGETVWLNPGESADIKKDDIAGALPDLGAEPPRNEEGDTDDRITALQTEIDGLKAQIEQETKRADEAEKLVADASTEIDALKAQIAKFDADGDGKPGGSKPKS
jgi:uncharacterized small protein (DUF1192 family)